MDEIAVLIPCYNEEQTVAKVVCDFRTALPGAIVYVYDNNSSDRTAELAAAAGAVVRREPAQGKGNVVRRMLREVDARCYLLVDGDDTYPAESAPRMVGLVLDGGADMVVGDRLSSTYQQQNKRPFHSFGNLLVRWSVNAIFGADVRDVMTGYRALSYQFAKTLPVLTGGFEIETEMTVHAADKRMCIENVVVEYRDRPAGSVSKLSTVRDGLRVLGIIGRLFRNYRPLAFFGAIALVLAALSVGFLVPVLLDYLATGLVERFPTLIVCGFVMLAAIQSLFSGLILQSLRQRDLAEFEMRLHEIHRELGARSDS